MDAIQASTTHARLDPAAPVATARDADLATAASAFEGYLVGAMLRIGTRPVGGESPLDGGAGGRMYRELFFEEIARLAAQGPGFGIGALLGADAGPNGTGLEGTR